MVRSYFDFSNFLKHYPNNTKICSTTFNKIFKKLKCNNNKKKLQKIQEVYHNRPFLHKFGGISSLLIIMIMTSLRSLDKNAHLTSSPTSVGLEYTSLWTNHALSKTLSQCVDSGHPCSWPASSSV